MWLRVVLKTVETAENLYAISETLAAGLEPATFGLGNRTVGADSDVIQAKKFEVLNEQGLIVAELGMDPEGNGALNVVNKGGVFECPDRFGGPRAQTRLINRFGAVHPTAWCSEVSGAPGCIVKYAIHHRGSGGQGMFRLRFLQLEKPDLQA